MSNDADALAALVRGRALPYRLSGVTTVVGIESRGFFLGAAVAVELGVGFCVIRKDGALFAGERITEQTEPDYCGNTSKLVALRNQFAPGDRALLVDDWIETGSQAKTARDLIERCGAGLIGISMVVDKAANDARVTLPPIAALIVAADLPKCKGQGPTAAIT